MIKRLKEKPNQNKTKQIETKRQLKCRVVWTLARHFYFSFKCPPFVIIRKRMQSNSLAFPFLFEGRIRLTLGTFYLSEEYFQLCQILVH